MTRRDTIIMYANILKACKNWEKPTHIRDKTHSNFSFLSKMLDQLRDKGLVEKKEVRTNFSIHHAGRKMLSNNPKTYSKCLYKATEKGLLFVQKIREAQQLLNGLFEG